MGSQGWDGDGEPLRVPPWLTGGDPVPPEPAHDQDLPVVPLAPPAYEERHALPLAVPDDVPAPDRRRRWVLAGVVVVLLLLPTLLVVSLLGKGKAAGPPIGVFPAYSDVSLPGPPSPLPSPAGAPSLSSRAAPPPVTAPTTATTTTRAAVRFGPVTFEAEAPGNVIGGSAWVDRYPGASGGAVVRNLGDWGDRRGAGFLRFAAVTVPVDGTYTLKFYVVNIDNERTRTAVITVSGQDPQAVTVDGGSACCTAASVRVTLRKGHNTITFGNDKGHAPSIDRIVLSLP